MGIEYRIYFVCDNCGLSVYFPTDSKTRAIDYARDKGWVVARDRVGCYCPKCADGARSVGSRGGFNSLKLYWVETGRKKYKKSRE
jgi:hypothetical protein